MSVKKRSVVNDSEKKSETYFEAAKNALADLKSLIPELNSHRPAAIAATAAVNCTAARATAEDREYDEELSESEFKFEGRRACRRNEDDNKDSSKASLKCDRMFLSRKQKSRAVLPLFTTLLIVKMKINHQPRRRK